MAHDSPFKADALAGKVALVTGGTSGIGLEIARYLGLHGCSVAVSGRRAAVVDDAVADLRAAGCTAMGLQGDVRSADDCKRWVQCITDEFGSLSILVNCAAGNFLACAEELSVNGFRTVMEIDTIGTFNVSRAAFPALRAAGDGRIINISATLHYGATWYQAHASAAKAAIDSLTRSLALEWGHFGIKVNGVAPGPIQGTAGMSKLAPGSEADMEAAVVETIPAGRMGRKADIALACVYLASSAGSFVSGHVMVVDGASWMWKPAYVPRETVSSVSRGVEKTSRQVGTAQRSRL